MKNYFYTSPLIDDSNYHIFVKPDLYQLTEREYQRQKSFCDVIQYWRAHPVQAIEDLIGAKCLDFQAYAIDSIIGADQTVLCMSRNSGKSTLIALVAMYLMMLYPNYHCVIASSNGAQATGTFLKLESIALKTIPSFKSLTGIFLSEVKRSQAKSNGFIHDPSRYRVQLNNGSDCITINGNVEGARGIRANIVFFDEAAVIPSENFMVIEPYITQDSNFGTGVGWSELDAEVQPVQMNNKLVYCSSAGSVEHYFYKKMREAWIHVLAGDPKYAVVDLPADGVINATQNGVKLVHPLLSQDTVDSALRTDKAGAMKEYLNVFDREGGEQSIIPRSAILRNSHPYVPELSNLDNKSHFIILWDPARRNDDSACLVCKVYQDPVLGWKLKIVNCEVLVDRDSKNKTMLSAPEQVKCAKRLLLRYNGIGVTDYENIDAMYIDSGAGGNGVGLSDFLCESWNYQGESHRGLIDTEYNPQFASRFPEADRETLHLIKPQLKAQMYEELIQCISGNLIDFPDEYTSNGHVDLIYEIDADGNRKQRMSYPSDKDEEELSKKGITIEIQRHELTFDEEAALLQINMLKNQLVNIWRYKTPSGTSRFELAPDKVNTMHDDKAYTTILAAHYLMTLRREKITKRKPRASKDLVEKLPIRMGKRQTIF